MSYREFGSGGRTSCGVATDRRARRLRCSAFLGVSSRATGDTFGISERLYTMLSGRAPREVLPSKNRVGPLLTPVLRGYPRTNLSAMGCRANPFQCLIRTIRFAAGYFHE